MKEIVPLWAIFSMIIFEIEPYLHILTLYELSKLKFFNEV